MSKLTYEDCPDVSPRRIDAVNELTNEQLELEINKELNLSYLVRIERDFINKIKSNYPEISNKYGIEKLRNIMAKKALNGLLVNTRFLMDHFKVVFQDKENKDKISLLITDFLDNQNKNIEDTFEEYKLLHKAENGDSKETKKEVGVSKNNSKGEKDTTKSQKSRTNDKKEDQQKKSEPEINLNYSPIKLNRKQELRIKDVKPKYESIGKTFLDEEKEYIEEALFCLQEHCFKAAVLMIWSTGISRILKHISNDIPDYNATSQVMKTNNRSFYKHICTNFQLNASAIEDIRHSSKDLQLLCYICYKGFITESDYKKLKANYDTRNDCAHPTKIKLNVNETIAIFENIFDLILNNKNI